MQLNALIPSPNAPLPLLLAARDTLELGALISIRLQDPEAFTRYFQQLQPFYDLDDSTWNSGSTRGAGGKGNVSKVTGLYLLLLLSQGDYAGFHTALEALETRALQWKGGAKGLEDDAFVQYPIRLEQALMEGSYDRVWGETKSERVPSEEFGIFSDVRRARYIDALI
jgi:26S proteasome regulatory subunit N12